MWINFFAYSCLFFEYYKYILAAIMLGVPKDSLRLCNVYKFLARIV